MKEEHRRTPRKRLQQFLLVLDRNSRQTLGRLVDISSSGMMLICSAPVPLEQTFQLEISPPEDSALPPIPVEARSIWVRSSSNNLSHHGCGFAFDHITEETQTLLTTLIALQESA